MLTVS